MLNVSADDEGYDVVCVSQYKRLPHGGCKRLQDAILVGYIHESFSNTKRGMFMQVHALTKGLCMLRMYLHVSYARWVPYFE